MMDEINDIPPVVQESEKRSANSYLIPASIIVGAAIIGGAVLYTASPSVPRESPRVVDTTGGVDLSNLEDDDPVLGSARAPVVIVEFGDFQCPYCKRFHDEARVEIVKKYVNTGKAKIVYRDFPIENIHLAARPAAEASECADDQGKFWEYHDALYTRQASITTMDFVALAAELGMDKKKFADCVSIRKYQDEVTADYQAGVKAGVDGTPAFFINGAKISGAQPFSVFETAIEAALKK